MQCWLRTRLRVNKKARRGGRALVRSFLIECSGLGGGLLFGFDSLALDVVDATAALFDFIVLLAHIGSVISDLFLS